MKRSTSKILTTHVGSLPELASLDRAAPDYAQRLREQVAAVVGKQREIGLDVINEGEYAKGGDWLSYIEERFEGCPGINTLRAPVPVETVLEVTRPAAEKAA